MVPLHVQVSNSINVASLWCKGAMVTLVSQRTLFRYTSKLIVARLSPSKASFRCLVYFNTCRGWPSPGHVPGKMMIPFTLPALCLSLFLFLPLSPSWSYDSPCLVRPSSLKAYESLWNTCTKAEVWVWWLSCSLGWLNPISTLVIVGIASYLPPDSSRILYPFSSLVLTSPL